MSNPQKERIYTIDEYLDFEEQSEAKHEYIDGYIYPLITAMAGGADAHNQLIFQLSTNIGSNLPKECTGRAADMKIRIEKHNLNTYADLLVICGEPEFYPHPDGKKLLLLNPIVIFEVLSEATDGYDHTDKWRYYQSIPSLTDYIMIASDMYLIEHFQRSGIKWLYEQCIGSDSLMQIESLSITLSLADVYKNVLLSERPQNYKYLQLMFLDLD